MSRRAQTVSALGRSAVLALTVATGCATAEDLDGPLAWVTTPGPGFTLVTTARDEALIPDLLNWGGTGRSAVEAFLGLTFTDPMVIRVFPDRASLVAYWRDVWNAPSLDAGCGSIAAARLREITVLSPASWRSDACGVDPQSNQPAFILAHELVHVLHEQRNPRIGEAAFQMPWFVEGLAVYGSGQLRRDYAGMVKELVVSGKAPELLGAIWSHPLRYGISGSVVQYLDELLGRPAFTELLGTLSPSDLLAMAQLSEGDLISGWKAWVATTR